METIKKYRPEFPDGTVLRAEQLQQLATQAYVLPNLIFKNYANGIITGCDISVEEYQIVISTGVFCFEKELYMIETEIYVPYSPENKWIYLKIKYIDTISTNGENSHIFGIDFNENPTSKNELELCRFKLQKGAKLRVAYDNFEDMNTEFDTVNILHVPFSSEDRSTLHPKVLERFANELMALSPQNILDQMICMQILNNRAHINLKEIAAYLKFRADIHSDNITNINAYRELQNILWSEKGKLKPIKKKTIERRKIIVD